MYTHGYSPIYIYVSVCVSTYLSSTELTELSIQVTQNDSHATTVSTQLLEKGWPRVQGPPRGRS